MIIEQLIFIVIAFSLFIYMFLKMLKTNDSNYLFIIIMQAIGMAIASIAVISKITLHPILIIAKYILGIIIPAIIVILENKKISLIHIANIAKATIYLKLGNTKKAKECLNKLIAKYPDTYFAHKKLAEIYELEGGMRKAIDEYVNAIDINKNDYDSYYKIANLLNDLDKKEEASEMLVNLLNQKPEYYKATELLGNILISKEMYKEAVNIYQDALKYNPVNFDLNYNLGIAYTMLNDFQNAKLCYERAAEINALAYNCKYSLAEIALLHQELEEAEKYFMELIEDEELSADSYYELSKIELIKGNKENAIQYAKMALDINLPKIAKKIDKDPIFIPILSKISLPFNIDEEEKESKLNKKEIKAKEHLEEMFEIITSIGYDDIERLSRKNGIKVEEINNEIEEQKERE